MEGFSHHVQTCGLCEGVTTLESSNEKEETDDPKKEKEADVSKLSYKERRRLAILKALRNRMARRRVGDRRRRDRSLSLNGERLCLPMV